MYSLADHFFVATLKGEYAGPGGKKISDGLMEHAMFSNPYNDYCYVP